MILDTAMYAQPIYIFVYQPDMPEAIPAAEMKIIDDDHVQIIYLREYLANKKLLPIDPVSVPRYQGPITIAKTALGAIRDALPDFWGRQVIARYLGADLKDLKDFSLVWKSVEFHLEGLNFVDRVGNIDFRANKNSREPDFLPPAYAKLEDLHLEVVDIEKNTPKKGLSPLLLEGSSLGGARPKCTIMHDGSLWVAKFPSKHDTWNNARVEMATMTLASLSGINVPEMRIAEIATGDVLLVKRFDRKYMGDSKFSRIGYMSALSLLGIDESERDKFSYARISDKMRTCASKPDDRIELYKRMVFNVLVRNIDDHPRNFGFLTGPDGISISPAFDLTPTVSNQGITTEAYQAMFVSSQSRLGTLENLQVSSERFGIDKSTAREIVDSMLASLTQWGDVFAQCGVSDIDTKKFSNTFETRWGDVYQRQIRQFIPDELQNFQDQINLSFEKFDEHFKKSPSEEKVCIDICADALREIENNEKRRASMGEILGIAEMVAERHYAEASIHEKIRKMLQMAFDAAAKERLDVTVLRDIENIARKHGFHIDSANFPYPEN